MTVRSAQKGHADRVLRYVALSLHHESGLLMWSEVAPEWPVKIAVNDGLEGYFVEVEGEVKPKISLQGASWAQDLPVIIGGEYESVIWGNAGPDLGERTVPQDAAIFKPELFTGLMRLAVQAKIGAGLSVQQLIPDGWGTADGTRNGIIVDPAGGFWICLISSTFCRAWPLLVPASLMQALTQIDAPVGATGAAMVKAWALAFAVAKPYDPETDPESPEVILWEQAEPLPGWPLAHGWHFDNAGTQAVRVNIESTIVNDSQNWHTGRLYSFTFGFNLVGGSYVPTGSVALSDYGNFVPYDGYSTIWVPRYGEYVLWHGALWDEEPFEGQASPIYAFFNNEDELQVIKYTTFKVEASPDQTSEDTGSYYGCGHNKTWTSGAASRTFRTRTGGISINGGSMPFETASTHDPLQVHTLSGSGGGTKTVWDAQGAYNSQPIFARTMPSYYGDGNVIANGAGLASACTPCRPDPYATTVAPFLPRPSLPDTGNSWRRFLKGTVQYQTATKTEETVISDTWYARQAIFVCATDAEAIVWCTCKRNTKTSSVFTAHHGNFETEVKWQAVWKEYSGSIWNWVGGEVYAYEETFPMHWLGTFGPCSNTFSINATPNSSTVWWTDNSDTYGNNTEVVETVTEEAEAEFVGRETVSLPAEFDGWQGATTDNVYFDNARSESWASVMQAWSDGAIIRSGSNGEMTTTAGWPERLVSTQRFMGGA